MKWAAKVLAIWIALVAGSVAGGLLIQMPAPTAAGDGPLTAGQALLIVNAIFAPVLAALSGRMAGPLWQRVLALFLTLYLAESLLSIIEAWYFGAMLRLPDGMLGGWAATSTIKAAVAAAVAASLWRGEGVPFAPAGLVWKLPAIMAFYVLCYFGAGLAVWLSEAVRVYYAGGLDINGGEVALLQLGRGALWTGLAWLLARHLGGSPMSKGVLAGLAFATFMAGPLLYPNPLMPWPVRLAHLAEIGVANFLFGLLAVWLLGVERKKQEAEAGQAR